MTFQPQLPPAELAAMIDREGLKFEYQDWGRWFLAANNKAADYLESPTCPIRLAPGALTEFGLKPGMQPHNPDNLPADKITEGGKYRAVMACELHEGDTRREYWDYKDSKWKQGWTGVDATNTWRVPINTPFPTTLLTTPPTTEPESETPRVDAEPKYFFGDNRPGMEVACVTSKYARQLETELRATQRKLDEANGLLEKVKPTLKEIIKNAPPSGPLWHGSDEIKKAHSTLTAITQHQAL